MDQDRELKTDVSGGRQSTRRWITAAILVYAVSFVLMAAFGTYSVIQGQRVNAALCRVSDDNRTTIVNILNFSRNSSLERAQTVEERNIIRASYESLIALVPPLKCSGGPQELEP